MRCNRRLLYIKVKSFLLLTTVLSALIVLITIINHRPSFLRNVSYSVDFSFKYTHEPGGFLINYKVNNESYCNFKYNLPGRFSYAEEDLDYSPELESKSSYRVLYNVLEAREGYNTSSAPVTYATHVTPEFINYISEIAKHWEGAVSVAAFVPDDDADFITRQLLHVCQCLPEMSRVSVHYVFPKSHPPYVKNLKNEQSTCAVAETSNYVTYRSSKKLPYPVNIARNVARQAANTDYVLVSDVELVPSEKLASRFNQMMYKLSTLRRLNYPSRVFVVPVFEVEKYENIPRSKEELVRLIKEEKALYFHRHICSHCQKFPGLENWIQQEAEADTLKECIKRLLGFYDECELFKGRCEVLGLTLSSYDDIYANYRTVIEALYILLNLGDTEVIMRGPLLVVKREYPFHRWEPIYIGTKNEPFYSEALSWEGKQDKMTQMLEMCLKGYRFVILDGAFLIHWPGVKRKSLDMKLHNKWRYPFLLKNTRQYNIIINNLASKYSRNPKCKVQ